MDGSKFDTLARGLVTRVTRRRAIAGILGLSVGAFVGADDAAAAKTCRLLGHKCIRSSQCCSGFCDQRRTTPRSQRNRCFCEFVGTEENCLACGDTCASGETCCGGSGCVELGTVEHCTVCGDACSTSGTGSSTEICTGDDGCQTVCEAAAGGFVTTDEPPVIYPGSVANNSSHLAYLRPLLSDPNVFQTCETSADCTATCPTNILLNGGTEPATGVACGCIKYQCRQDGSEYFHFINIWNEVPRDTYVCMVLMKE